MSRAKNAERAAGPRRFKPYPAYKDSGVEWLGGIPVHWELKRLKFAAHVEAGQSPPSEFVTDGSEGLSFLQGNADFGPLSPTPRQVCDVAPKRARTGDILLSVRAPVGTMNIADQPYGIGRGLCAIRPAGGVDSQFCFYVLATTRSQLDAVATGSTYDAVTTSQVGDLPALLPQLPEQRAIAAFLDRETARIDALVAKKEQLIELLREKRAALITRAVTKGLPGAATAQAGLDPNVPMKDSGVEWLGEIPAHWSTFRFKLLFRDIYRYPTYYDIEYVPDGVPEVRGEALLDGQIIALPDQRYISAETSKQFARTILQEGDLVISVRGTMGKVGLVLGEFVGANITANLLRLSPREDLASGSYLSWLMRSEFFLKALDKQSPQTTIQTITMPQLASIVLPIPGLTDQRVIAAFLNRETARIDALEAKVRDAIERLKEFRTALIAAAVTGKIDVRGGAEG